MGNLISVSMIWALETGFDSAPWLVDAWDEFSIDENNEGWLEALRKAGAASEVIKVITTTVDYGRVQYLMLGEADIISSTLEATA